MHRIFKSWHLRKYILSILCFLSICVWCGARQALAERNQAAMHECMCLCFSLWKNFRGSGRWWPSSTAAGCQGVRWQQPVWTSSQLKPHFLPPCLTWDQTAFSSMFSVLGDCGQDKGGGFSRRGAIDHTVRLEVVRHVWEMSILFTVLSSPCRSSIR